MYLCFVTFVVVAVEVMVVVGVNCGCRLSTASLNKLSSLYIVRRPDTMSAQYSIGLVLIIS